MNRKVLIPILTLIFAIIICGTSVAADWTVGPGGTYDYTTIQSAIDSATTVPGDTITVYDDTGNPYTYTENVVVNKNGLTITTTGLVTVSGSSLPNSPVIVIPSTGSQSTISGFTITGATGASGVLTNGATDVTLNDLTITNCQRGVYITGSSSNINVNHATITGTTSNGVFMEGSPTNITIQNCSISGSGGSGIEKYSGSDLDGLTVSNTTIFNPNGRGINLPDYYYNYMRNVVLDNVTISGAISDGIRIIMSHPNSANVTITDTTVSDCYQYGMILQTMGVFDFERNTLTHNGFNGASGADGAYYGLYLVGDGNTSTTITGDNSFNRNRNGVYLQNVGQIAVPILFNGGLMVDNAGYVFWINGGRYVNISGGFWDDASTQASTGSRIYRALHVTGTSNDITLDGVSISGTSNNGVYLEGAATNITIENCSISGSGGSGIEKYSGSDLDGLTVSNTTIFNPNGRGINLPDYYYNYMRNVVLDNVTISGAISDGIRIIMSHPNSANVTITDTTVSDCYQYGMILQTRGTLTLRGNTFTHNGFNGGLGADNQFYGLYLLGGGNTDITISPDNAFNLNRNGVFLQNVGAEANPITFDGTLIVDNAGYPFFLQNVHYITIQDAVFDDVTTQANTGYRIQRAVYFEGTNNNITLNRLTINQTALSSIEKYNDSDLDGLTVSNTTITNPSGYGIVLTDYWNIGKFTRNVVLDDVMVTGATLDGIRITMAADSSANITITDTTVTNSTQHGIYLQSRGVFDFERNTLTHNGFNGASGIDGAYYGLYLVGDGNTSTTITGDNSFNRNRNGVYLQNVGQIAVPILFNGGLLLDNAGYIFLINGGRYINISGGVWDDASTQASTGSRIYRALHVTGTSNDITLDGVSISGTSNIGVYLEGAATNITIQNCSISGSGASGIEKYNDSDLDGLTVSNTTITNPSGYGIVLTDYWNIGKFTRNVVLDDVMVTGATLDGIRITMAADSSANITITDTTVTNSTQHGMYLQSRGNTFITDNNIQGSVLWGVYLIGSNNPTVTFNNNLISNNGNGLRLEGISGVNFQDNQLINNTGDDLYATGDTSNTFTRLTVGLAHPTTVSFDYINGIIMNGVESPPADIPGLLNIVKYVDMQGLGSTSVNLKVYYSPADIIGLNEASLKIFRYNTAWSVLPSPNGVNTTERYVYADGITSFSTFAVMGGPADTVYVDGVNGNESNDGFTPLTAKLTINTGIGLALNNWTVNVYPNITYNENVLVNKDLTLQPYGVGNVALNGSITINSAGSGSTILGFSITGSSSAGISLESADNCQIIGNTLSGNFMGIYLYSSDNNTISGNMIQSNGWVGVCIDNSSNNVVNGGNNINGNVEGVFIVNASNGNTITANNIHHNTDTGITILNGPTGNIITGNIAISSNSVIGVLVRNAGSNTISGNTIEGNGWAGISLDQADGNIINGANIISGNQEGINITNASSGNTISGNAVTGNTNIGISVISGSSGNFIIGNTAISDNGIIGVYLRGSDTNTISGNTIQNNDWVGVCFDTATVNTINSDNNISGNLEGLYIVNNSNNNIIAGNNIHNNQDTGIYIDGSTGNQINSNTAISSNGVIGILFRNADGNIISGNTLFGNNWVGIALDNADSNNIIGLNTISVNNMGVYVTNNSSGNVINNNSLQNNSWAGIVLDYASNNTIYQNNFNNNPLQALAQNGTGNAFYQGTTGNYWSDWPSTQPRLIDGNEFLYDEYPSTSPY